MKYKKKIIWLTVILSLSLFLRVYSLGTESLWIDEAYSFNVAKSDTLQHVIEKSASIDVHPPLYYSLLHYWMILFGNSEFSMRLLSAILGVLAVFTIYKIGVLLFDEETGIISSLLLGISVFHLYYSQEARMYSLMTLLILASFYFLIRLLKKTGARDAGGYVISSALLLYTHIYGFFALASQNIFVFVKCILLKQWKELKQWIVLQALVILPFVPWIGSLMRQISKEQEGIGHLKWIPKTTTDSFLSTLAQYGSIDMALWLLGTLSIFAVIVHIRKNRNECWKIWIMLLWLITPFILPIIISQFLPPIFLLILTIGALPAFYLLAAYGIRKIDSTYAKAFILLIILALSAVSVFGYYDRIDKEQWREVVRDLEAKAQEGDLVLFHPSFLPELAFAYYETEADFIKKGFPERASGVNDENIAELEPVIKGYSRVWLVVSHSYDPDELIQKELNKRYQLMDHHMYVKIDVYFFEEMTEDGKNSVNKQQSKK